LLKNILQDTDPAFLKWALRTIALLQNQTLPANLFHIHGTKDRLLPFRKNRGIIPVENGGHLMILSKAEEISTLLKEILEFEFKR
jgi:hypothetical protein